MKSTTTSGRRIVLAARPRGKPLPEDFRPEEALTPEPGDGEMLLAGRYLSLDPYMRGRMPFDDGSFSQ
jgi:NADPH-dependent curcumin reductase CurA